MSYPALAAIRSSYTFLQSGKTEAVSVRPPLGVVRHQLTSIPQLSRNLRTLTAHLHACLQQLLAGLPGISDGALPLLSLPPTLPQSPIFSLLTPYPKQLAAYCQQHGFVVRGIVPPTVPEGAARVRICLHAGNTVEEVEGLVRVVGMWARVQHRTPSVVEERARL
jgi:8-amino-7-oxononanoate synthase